MLDKLKTIYSYIPNKTLFLLRILPNRLIFGKSYEKMCNSISYNTNFLSFNIHNILCYSRENTAYGMDNIPKIFNTDESFSVLSSLPIISSDDLSLNLEYFKSKQYGKSNSYMTTTGGTGRKATTVVLSNDCFGAEWAHIHRIWREAGYDRRTNIKLTLRGKSLKGEKLVKYNPIYNELVVDSFKLNRNNFLKLINNLRKWNFEYIHGYPSLLKEFMEYCILFNVYFNIKGIFLGSEGISIDDRKLLKEYFNCKVISWYGQTEKIILAADFTGDNQYKVYTSYGFPSINKPDVNGFGEIIGTTFINKALPLINYRTGDFGKIITSNDNILLTKIKGRWGKDFIFLDKDKKIPTSSINIHGLVQKEIIFYQVYQEEYGRLLIKVLPKPSSRLSEDEIIKLFKEAMYMNLKEFDIDIVIVNNESEIKKSKRGKLLMLIQNIK